MSSIKFNQARQFDEPSIIEVKFELDKYLNSLTQ